MLSKSFLRPSSILLLFSMSILVLAQEADEKKASSPKETNTYGYAFKTVNGKSVVVSSQGNEQTGHVFISGENGTVHDLSDGEAPVWVSSNGQGGDGNMVVLRATSKDADGNPILLDFQANHGRLGLECVDLTEELRAHFGAPTHAGIMIGRVVPDGPAAEAGLQVGDILTHLNGEPIVHSAQLLGAILAKKPGDLVDAELWRNGAILDTSIVLGEAKEFSLYRTPNEKTQVLLSPNVRGNFHFKTWTSSDEKPVVEWVNVESADIKKTIEEMQKKIADLEQRIIERSKKGKNN